MTLYSTVKMILSQVTVSSLTRRAAMLTESFLDKTDPSGPPLEDRVLVDLFERVYNQGRITEFVNLQTGERVNNGYVLQQVRLLLRLYTNKQDNESIDADHSYQVLLMKFGLPDVKVVY